MDLLLALFLLILGDVQADKPDLTMEKLAQAIEKSQHAVIVELPGKYDPEDPEAENPDASGEGERNTFVKWDPQHDTAPVVKGVYVTAHSADGSRMQSLLDLLDSSELNSMVIDVKDDHGYVTFETNNAVIKEMETTKKIIRDPQALMQTLDEHNIYPIARIVVFKDSVLARKKPEWSFKNPDGSVWANNKSTPESFVNPYVKEVWDYNIEVAREAIKLGFKEIQFDYVRFPEGFEKRADILTYQQDERPRTDAVANFVRYAREQLESTDTRVSVDIFGYAASVPAAEGIGQDFNKISQFVDVISPMVYPSHYTTGWFGSTVPDAAPYATIKGAMEDTHEKLEEIKELKPIIRPWIQDFTATWVRGYIPYGKAEIEAQVRAMKEQNIDEFLLWNSGNRYSPGVDYDLDGQVGDTD
ncbi:putative glycoside hydrolase [Marinicrinis sediminis]|uniref:Glycoside hydrolase n=1 Tax=Marinicrinis sediminis TaxID=1652465 RepID=A0ABW5R7X4_9BACL